MRRFHPFREWPLLVGVLSGVACAGLFGNITTMTTADHLKFPHSRHIKAKLECIVCHDSVYDATDLTKWNTPKEAVCLQCHGDQKTKGNCGFCHSNVNAIQPRPPPQIPFTIDHSAHLNRLDNCVVCHKSLPEPGRPADPPPMSACLSCHNHQDDFAKGECGKCHVDLWNNPLKPQSFFAHQADFLRQHASIARSSGAACSVCHQETFCSDCHAKTVGITVEDKNFERVDRQFIHRGDWLSRHAAEANADPASCEQCHTTSSCESCHTAQNVGAAGTNPRSPHPPGWAFPGSAQFHGDAARLEVESCAACHDHGGHPDCVQCHRVGGIGGNPHPASFLARHRTVERQPMCLECHL